MLGSYDSLVAGAQLQIAAENQEIPANTPDEAVAAEQAAATGTQEQIPTGTQEQIPTGTQEIPTGTPDEAVATQRDMAAGTQQQIPTATQEIPTDTPDEAVLAAQQDMAAGTQQVIPTGTQVHSIDTQSTVPGLEDSQLPPSMEWSSDAHGTVRDMLFQCADIPASNLELLGQNLTSCVAVIRDHVCLSAGLDVGAVTTRLGLEDLSEDDACRWGAMLRDFEAQYQAACVLEREVCAAQEQALTGFVVKEQQADELKKMLSDHLQKKKLSQATFDSKVKAIEANLKLFYEESQVETNAKVTDAVLHQNRCADALLMMWDKLPVSAKARLPVSLTANDAFEDNGDDEDLQDLDRLMNSFMDNKPNCGSSVKAEPGVIQPPPEDVVINLSDDEEQDVPQKATGAKAIEADVPSGPKSKAPTSAKRTAMANKSTIDTMEEASA
ncbi:Ogfr [Symbiodinium sp. CCMP2592]|nr:Ogfr [Symbiodinium sp. CCMP2592]